MRFLDYGDGRQGVYRAVSVLKIGSIVTSEAVGTLTAGSGNRGTSRDIVSLV